MKKVVLLILVFSALFAKEYSIIAFSTKKFDKKAAELFIKRFPQGIVKKYSRFVEYKIEPFKSYKEAKEFLKKVKKYYKYPLIVPYRPNLGVVIFPKKTKNKKTAHLFKKVTSLPKKATSIKTSTSGLVFCKTECGCVKSRYKWEVNKTKILKDINVSVKHYLGNENNITVLSESNNTEINITCRPSMSDYIFYVDLYGNVYNGQKDLYGDSENVKLGFIYEKYFSNFWKFYTDDRIILSRKNNSGDVSNDLYLDINELYLRSFCFNNDLTDILIGRKKTKDFRSWWYDMPLDEIKLFSENYLLTYELIFATRLNDKTFIADSLKSNIKYSRFLIFHTNYEYFYKNNVDFYYMYESLHPKTIKRKAYFLGLRAYGDYKNLFYWADFGYSKNIDTDKSGIGLDIGIKAPVRSFYVAGSFAFGSSNFIQPYISSNYSDFLQKSFSFKYYGNVLYPNLENLYISSFYVLKPLDENKTLIASFHNYRQDVLRKVTFNQNYFYPTNGKSKSIGNEIDVVYQFLKTRFKKLKIGGGYFFGGNAFSGRKNAYRFFVSYRYYWK
jgi:hypothetical protein